MSSHDLDAEPVAPRPAVPDGRAPIAIDWFDEPAADATAEPIPQAGETPEPHVPAPHVPDPYAQVTLTRHAFATFVLVGLTRSWKRSRPR